LDPIEIDENGVILSGHTRYKALQKLGYKTVDVILYTGLTDEQKRKYRILANKTGELV
jgi:ParB-like chromosome segregation protein Spo0J